MDHFHHDREPGYDVSRRIETGKGAECKGGEEREEEVEFVLNRDQIIMSPLSIPSLLPTLQKGDLVRTFETVYRNSCVSINKKICSMEQVVVEEERCPRCGETRQEVKCRTVHERECWVQYEKSVRGNPRELI